MSSFIYAYLSCLPQFQLIAHLSQGCSSFESKHSLEIGYLINPEFESEVDPGSRVDQCGAEKMVDIFCKM